jgi:hypothetical protein
MSFRFVKRYSGAEKSRVQTGCLFRYDEPVSPHLAAQIAGGTVSPNIASECQCLKYLVCCLRFPLTRRLLTQLRNTSDDALLNQQSLRTYMWKLLEVRIPL